MKRILQSYADYLIKKLEQSKTQEEFDNWYNTAVMFDFYTTKFGIYLD
jgi:hypothetical protein